ncbi:hypothetical protein E1A91_A09G128600v1 [Gossypium mustelinum]|uniref:Uncharacterized protein n=1 Tax=Gossypium mustelinum TaxID=34275 RepID=A0A5D2XWU4_GOSMU|nr:hypothetical protein E1A91_A09G128600v1 [Gossypium mustelinum]
MTMPLGVALEMAKMVWIALSGWVCSCLTIADEVAASLRSGDIGPFHEKPERRIRSMGNQKAKTISNFIHWCGLQSSVIGFLKFQCAVKCRFSLIMLVCLYYKAPWFGLRL